MVLGQSDGMVEATAPGVERDRLGRPPHRLEVPRKVVRRWCRPRVVHDPDRLNDSTYADTKQALALPTNRLSDQPLWSLLATGLCELATGLLPRRTT